MTHDSRGVAAITFALIAPILIGLLAIMFYVATVGLANSTLSYATQQAAIVTAQQSPAAGQAVFASNTGALPLLVSPTMTCTPGTGSVTCSAVSSVVNFFAGVFGSPTNVPITASATAAIPATTP